MILKDGKVKYQFTNSAVSRLADRTLTATENLHDCFNYMQGERDLTIVDHRMDFWYPLVQDNLWVEIWFAPTIRDLQAGPDLYVYSCMSPVPSESRRMERDHLALIPVATGVEGNEYLMLLDTTRRIPMQRTLSFREEMAMLIQQLNPNMYYRR